MLSAMTSHPGFCDHRGAGGALQLIRIHARCREISAQIVELD